MKKAVMVFAALAIALLAVLAYAGFFRKVSIEEGVSPKYTLVLKKSTGAYSQAGVVLEEVQNYLKSIGVEPEFGVGIYLDDPRTVKKEDLRWVAGYVLPDSARKKAGSIRKKYMVRDFKPGRAAMATFPHRNRLNLVAGIMKVYPALSAYAVRNKVPPCAIAEIYDMKGRQIIYIMPLVKGWDAVKLYYGK